MTQEQIIEGNKLIADSPFSHEGMRESIADDKARGYDDDYCYRSLKYDSSWDWLMPVVEKIELVKGERRFSSGAPRIHLAGKLRSITTIPLGTPIQDVWLAIVEFITWYNTQSK